MNWDDYKPPRWFNPRVIAWSLYDFGATAFSMVVLSRYLGFWVLREKHGTMMNLQLTMGISMAVAGVIQVLLSPISDELGRRRIFVLIFTLISVAACAGMGLPGSLSNGLYLFALANVGYQTAYVFYYAMLGDISDSRHTSRIAGIGIGLGYLGSVIGLIYAKTLVNNQTHLYSPIFVRIAGLMFLFSLPLLLFVREKPGLVRFNLSQSLENSVGAFTTTLRRVLANREMLFFFLGCLLALDALATVTVNMSLYAEGVVGLDVNRGLDIHWKDRVLLTLSELDAFLIVSTFFAVVGAPIIGHIADKTDRYKTLLGVVILWMFALFLAMFAVQRKLFWFTGPIFGLCFSGMWTASRSYLLELCHPEERSQMFAIFGFVGKGAALIGPLIWGTVFTFSSPHFGERKAYRLSLAAIFVLTFLGYLILQKARRGNRGNGTGIDLLKFQMPTPNSKP